jgi:glycopeptide antibiotics resistance protein
MMGVVAKHLAVLTLSVSSTPLTTTFNHLGAMLGKNNIYIFGKNKKKIKKKINK